MGWTGYDYNPEKTVYQHFKELEVAGKVEIKCWRYGDQDNRDIHFAARTSSGPMFTGIAYTQLSGDPDGARPLILIKVVDMSQGLVQPLHPHVQKYYDEHQQPCGIVSALPE